MGNKRKTIRERTCKDPRTKKSRKKGKQSTTTTKTFSSTCTTTPDPDVSNNTSMDLDEASSLPGPSKSSVLTASERKIRGSTSFSITPTTDDDLSEPELVEEEETVVPEVPNTGYLLMDTGILFPLLDELLKCNRCGYCVQTAHIIDKKQGLAHMIKISCRNISCRWERSFYTSNTVERDGRGANPFDVNLRAIMSFRELGKGYTGLQTFCGYMNMPPPMTECTYNETIKSRLYPTYTDVAKQNMKDAAEELRREVSEEYDENNICDTAVSVDGTWQRRGFASLNGVVTAVSIDTGKCLSYECLVKTCKSCEIWTPRKGTIEYENFLKEHECPINHVGSAGAMEAVGAVKMFGKSVADLQLRFTTYIGDGDSKAHPAVVASNPYGIEKTVNKGECVGHVQKRVGGRLRKLTKASGSKRLEDGKKLGGVGRLNGKVINKLQNYYGLAIRQNTDSLVKMRKAVGAVIYHCSEASTAEQRHMFCDVDSEWCKYRMAEKKGETYIDKAGLPLAVRNEVMPIFQDLSSEVLLKKCLHGCTQNNNESFNGFIWKRLPKDIFVGWYTLQMGVSSALLSFNSGARGLVNVFEKLGMSAGYFTQGFCAQRDSIRINKMKRKMSTEGKGTRKRNRAIKKGFEVRDEDKEGVVYESGMMP